jgi:nicotinamide riboside kinase
MLISFSGAQSTGKSTLLKMWQEAIPEWDYIPEVTRLVKREYDLPINEDGNDLTQTMIMGEHLRNAFIKREKHAILDRCSLDGLVYTHWLCDNKKVSVGAYSHARYVFDNTIDKYDLIIYTSPEDVPVVDDGERSINIKFREEIIELFEQYLITIPERKLLRVRGDVRQRIDQIGLAFEYIGMGNYSPLTFNRSFFRPISCN